MPRPRTACLACVVIKCACSKEHPCSRCDRLSIPCSYDGVRPSRGSSARPEQKTYLTRLKHKNSTSGCRGCLARRKKCDEVLPVCGDCQRLGVVCIPRAAANASMLRTLWQVDLQPDLEEGPPLGQSCVVSQSAEPTESDANRTRRRQFSRAYLEWVALLDEHNIDDSARRGHLNDSSALMYRNTSKTSLLPSHFDSALRNFPAANREAISQWDSTEQHLLNHYIQIVARALVVVYDDRNPFLLEILPMAVNSMAVRHAMLALSARHLCRLYPAFEDTLLKQRTLALHFLKLELHCEAASATAFIATLLMCLFEICKGNSPKWILHMCGAKALIDSTTANPISGNFVELFNHICCMSMVTSDKVALILEETPQSPVSEATRPSAPTAIHPFLGLAEHLYGCLRYINLLRYWLSDVINPLEDNDFTPQLIAAEHYLESWTPPTSSLDNWHHAEAVSAAQAVRWGCIIWVQHSRFGYSGLTESRQLAVDEILSAVSQIRPGSSVELQLLFPLFMAGVTATRKAERLRIEYRLTILESTIGMGNIAEVQRVLDAIWKKSNEGHDIVEWELLLRQEHNGICLM